MRNRPCLVLSPVGTSLLTNQASPALRAEISRYANAVRIEDVPESLRRQIQAICLERVATLSRAENAVLTRASAELNGLIRYLKRDPEQQTAGARRTELLLLCTDTWIGRQAGEAIREVLNGMGLNARIEPEIVGLRTNDLDEFRVAMTELVGWCAEHLVQYRRSGYRVAFNLTGGFKSIQGFLQTLSLFYADESIYIFESGGELLFLPRLPVRLLAEEHVRDHLRCFRRLGMALSVTQADLAGVSDILLFRMDGQAVLSEWGRLMWEQAKPQLYSERLWESPSLSVQFESAFANCGRKLKPDRLQELNGKVDLLARFQESGRRDNPRSLHVHALQNPSKAPSTHLCYAWSDQAADRLYLHFDEERLIVDSLGRHL